MRSRLWLRLSAAGFSIALLASGCGGAAQEATGPTEPSTTASPTPVATEATATPAAPTPTGQPPTGTTPTGTIPTAPAHGGDQPGAAVEAVPEGQELLLRTADGQVDVIATLDPAGESFFVSAAARPGSTATDATIVAATQAEGVYDLCWLEILGGEPGELQLFGAPYRPASDMAAVNAIGPTVAWSPDGMSVGWIEWNSDGETTLRTVGWDDGPGTGNDATDNAAFGVEPIPAGSRIESWTSTGPATSQMAVVGPDGGGWTIAVERQADGALALPPDAIQPR